MRPFNTQQDVFTKKSNFSQSPHTLRPFSASVNKFPLTVSSKKKFLQSSSNPIPLIQNNQSKIRIKLENPNLKVYPQPPLIDRMMSAEHRPYLENEKLYEHCMNLKNTVNNLNKKLLFAKSDIVKRDLELKKQNKFFQEICSAQNLAKSSVQLDLSKGFFKIKEMNLVSGLKKKYQDVKKELRETENELQEIKRTMRNTKIKEAVIEAGIYQEEMNCLKGKYAEALIKIGSYEKLEKEIKILRDNSTRQETIIHQLQEENKALKKVSLSKLPLYNDNLKKTKHRLTCQEMEAELEKKNKCIQDLEMKIQRLTSTPQMTSQDNIFDNLLNYTFDQVKEFSEMLVKNLENLNIDRKTFEENVIDMQSKDNESPYQIFANAVISHLKIKGLSDKTKIFHYSESLFDLCKCDINEYKSKLRSYFSNIAKYNFNHEKQRMKNQLMPFKDAFINSMTLYDNNKTGCVNFYNAKKAISSALPNANRDLIELILYAMKKFEPESLEGMRYDKVVELLNDKEDEETKNDLEDVKVKDPKAESTMQEVKGDIAQLPLNQLEAAASGSDTTPVVENEEEVVITIEQFNKKVDKVLSQIAEKLLTSKKSVKEFFKELITLQTIAEGQQYEAISLKDFIQILQNNGIKLDTIDIYCIFSKLKYSDDYETIEINKLQDEMANYGIFVDNIGTLTNENKNEKTAENKVKHDKEQSI